MEVLHFLGQGLTSKQMATRLNISSRTVDSHRQKIMQKLEISNGPGLVNFAIKHGFDLDH
jgi:DNA-binding NarL/FixJ family response regulator